MDSKEMIFVLYTIVCLLHCSESGKVGVVKITDRNWSQTLEGQWLIKFYAPWCPACKAIAPIWTELSEWSQELDTNIAEVDVTEEPGLSGRFAVTSLPTIYHASNGVFRRYLGPRTKDDLITLMEDKKYEEIDPVPWWQAPNSIPMTLLSWVFKISMLVRVTHTIVTEEYGFPAWSSYGFFAVITVMLGLLLGMILVLLADCIWPVKGRPASDQQMPPVDGAALAEGDKEDEEEKEGEGEEEEGGGGKKETDETDEVDAGKTGDQTVRRRQTEKESAT